MRLSTLATVLSAGILAAACYRPAADTLTSTRRSALGDTLIVLDSVMNAAVDNLDCAKGLSYIGDERPLFVSGGHVVQTHEQLLKGCQDIVAPRTGARYVARSVTAHVLSRDAGYVVKDGEYVVRLRSGETRTEQLAMTTIWARQDGVWKMVHLHESAIAPAAAR
jgi:ketosteroid isomerase-like protein